MRKLTLVFVVVLLAAMMLPAAPAGARPASWNPVTFDVTDCDTNICTEGGVPDSPFRFEVLADLAEVTGLSPETIAACAEATSGTRIGWEDKSNKKKIQLWIRFPCVPEPNPDDLDPNWTSFNLFIRGHQGSVEVDWNLYGGNGDLYGLRGGGSGNVVGGVYSLDGRLK